MTDPSTRDLLADAAGLREAARLLSGGETVAFPTETVYGLGADARNDAAVARVFAAKGRPVFNPLIAHVSDLKMAQEHCVLGPLARRLADAFWPGPLTLVAQTKPDSGISKLVTAGLGTVAIRVPAHPVAQDLIRALGGPIAAPSANPSGRVSPTTAAHVRSGLAGRIAAIVDGGPCTVGVESTILDVSGPPRVLRAGGVPIEDIEKIAGQPVPAQEMGKTPNAPGQLASHYAPKGKVRLNAPYAMENEVFLGFGPVAADLNLSKIGDLTEAAAALFDCFHRLDAMGAAAIAVAPVPDHGLGRAINDRLRRAAAPRD